MSENLVIVESPHKAKTIQKYLGSNYKVVASVGHICDLEVGNKDYPLGVVIEENFKPIYKTSADKTKVVSQLRKYVKDADNVYLATDPDREGEAISWHLATNLGLDVATVKRLEFHEITRGAILDAVEHPRTIDMNLVSSQETRRIIDRIIGFKLSQLVKKKIDSPSAGRVQSVVLQLITDRQKEVDNFKESIFYKVNGTLLVDGKEINVSLVDANNKEVHFDNIEDANKIIDIINNNPIKVKSHTNAIKNRPSKPVFTTSTMLQEASTQLKFNSKKTMKAAQSLYEGIDLGKGEIGLITYMRTDSVRIAPSFINKAKDYIKETYGEEYVGTAKIFNKNTDNVQDAHEGIRPTDIKITPEMVEQYASKDEAKLYRLIYIKTLASIMKDESYEHEEVIFMCKDNYLQATGDTQIFDGFTKIIPKMYKTERIPLKVKVTNSSDIKNKELTPKESKTKGPSLYSEASLIDTMKEKGIGRPSTYATTIELIKNHDYVEVTKNGFIPTEKGKLTISKLEDFFSEIINVEYTAKMETKLDEIAENKCTKSEALADYYNKFKGLYDVANKEMEKAEFPKEDLGLCPECGSPLVKRKSFFGEFIGCSSYPKCRYTYSFSKAGQECPKCHEGKLILKTGKFGKFYACSNFTKCKYKESIKN